MTKNTIENMDVWEITKDIQKMLTEHTRLLLDQYKTINGIYRWPNKVFNESIREYWPDSTKKAFEAFDTWLEQELQIFEKNIYEFVGEYTKEISELKIIAPSPDIYRQMVDEHTKLGIANYQKLNENRKQIVQESLDVMKKTVHPSVYTILETAFRWIMEQNEIMEKEILDRVKKISLALKSNGKIK